MTDRVHLDLSLDKVFTGYHCKLKFFGTQAARSKLRSPKKDKHWQRSVSVSKLSPTLLHHLLA